MTNEWVEAVWEESTMRNVVASDTMFDKYKCPPFYKLDITTSGLEGNDREKIANLVNKNGNKIPKLNLIIYLLLYYAITFL